MSEMSIKTTFRTEGEPTGKTYELRTIRDLFSVPPDRLSSCLNELCGVIVQFHAVSRMYASAIEAETGQRPNMVFDIPDCFPWVDDGRGEIETRFGPKEDQCHS